MRGESLFFPMEQAIFRLIESFLVGGTAIYFLLVEFLCGFMTHLCDFKAFAVEDLQLHVPSFSRYAQMLASHA